MKKRILLLLTATVVAIGCQAANAAKKPTGAGQANTEMAKCIASARVWDITFKHELASFMGVSLDRVPAIFCQRIFEGVRTGRISFSDVNAIQLSQPTEIWTVIKGKPKRTPVTHSLPPQSSRLRNCSGIDGFFQVPISQKCPLSGWAKSNQPTKIEMQGKAKAATPAPRNPKFRTCSNVYSGTFEVPASRKCPLGGG